MAAFAVVAGIAASAVVASTLPVGPEAGPGPGQPAAAPSIPAVAVGNLLASLLVVLAAGMD